MSSNAYHELATKKGWWDPNTKPDGTLVLTAGTIIEKVGLIFSEYAEWLDVSINGDPDPDPNGKPNGEVHELADIHIRSMDLIGAIHRAYGNPEVTEPADAFIEAKRTEYRDLTSVHHAIVFWCANAIEFARTGEWAATVIALHEVNEAVSDLAIENGLDLAAGIMEKHAYNETRTRRHGDKLA